MEQFFIFMESYIGRKAIGNQVGRTSREVDNPPARPQIRTGTVQAYMGGARENKNPITVKKIVPLAPARLIPLRGGIVIGGGTSTEALRRARRNQERRS